MGRSSCSPDYAAAMPGVHSRATRRLLCGSATVTVGLALAACGSSAGGNTTAASYSNASGRKVAVASRGASSSGRCSTVPAPVPKGAQNIPKPTLKLDPTKSYVVTLSTNCGSIAIELDVRQAPRTTSSFAYLVKRGFYNDLTFHRVAANFVIQGGDPNGDGSGGPGYTIVEPPPSDTQYTLGTVAMAKTSINPSGTSGSQFFIVTTNDASLPPQYALIGKVVGSFAGVRTIAKLPTNPPGDGAPKTPVVISSATLSDS
jgi:peptidyl-prolyl cis-trans isomerase B (cyclophilin B)